MCKSPTSVSLFGCLSWDTSKIHALRLVDVTLYTLFRLWVPAPSSFISHSLFVEEVWLFVLGGLSLHCLLAYPLWTLSDQEAASDPVLVFIRLFPAGGTQCLTVGCIVKPVATDDQLGPVIHWRWQTVIFQLGNSSLTSLNHSVRRIFPNLLLLSYRYHLYNRDRINDELFFPLIYQFQTNDLVHCDSLAHFICDQLGFCVVIVVV